MQNRNFKNSKKVVEETKTIWGKSMHLHFACCINAFTINFNENKLSSSKNMHFTCTTFKRDHNSNKNKREQFNSKYT